MSTDPNMSEQSGQSEQTGTQNQSTAMERNQTNPKKTKTKPRMWWEQISEYFDLTYHKNLEDLMNHGTEGMDAHTIYHLNGPKSKA